MPCTTFVLKPSTFGASKAVNVQHSTFPGTPNKLSLSNEVKKISDFRADNFFANVYYDFHNMLSAK